MRVLVIKGFNPNVCVFQILLGSGHDGEELHAVNTYLCRLGHALSDSPPLQYLKCFLSLNVHFLFIFLCVTQAMFCSYRCLFDAEF